MEKNIPYNWPVIGLGVGITAMGAASIAVPHYLLYDADLYGSVVHWGIGIATGIIGIKEMALGGSFIMEEVNFNDKINTRVRDRKSELEQTVESEQ